MSLEGNRPPIEGGLNTLRACDSTYVRDPFLGLRLGCGSGLRRKLEHCCFLTFNHVRQEHDLPVWKLQRIMMGSRVVLIDLPEDRRRMSITANSERSFAILSAVLPSDHPPQ